MPEGSEQSPDSQAARAVRHQTMLIIFLVAMAILAWVVWMKLDQLSDAEKTGEADHDCYMQHLDEGDFEPYSLRLPCDDE